MKNRHFLSVLLCLLALPMVSKTQAYVSIEDLNASPPERWQQTYETKWHTVEIDVLPTIQQVDKVPILKVAMDFWLPDVSALGEEWESIVYDHGVFYANRNDLSKMQSKETVTKRFSTPYDPSQKYGENTDLSLGDALSYLKTVLKNIGLPTDM